jgi:23S rRNA (adenine2503-C2)-methyltransferase
LLRVDAEFPAFELQVILAQALFFAYFNKCMKTQLVGMTVDELVSFVEGFGEKRYRALQIFHWIYNKFASSFNEMTDISASFRQALEQCAELSSLHEVNRIRSIDGTTKFLFELFDGARIESVLIPSSTETEDGEGRLTLCVSTQVGCPLACAFCATGTMGFTRNLTTNEIVDQVITVQRSSSTRISNIVFMGMGEPMLNFENVLKAISILNDEKGLAIGARHITISTAGYADQIRRLADEFDIPVKLALSLHTLDNEKRTLLMPITKKYSVSELLNALEYYYRKTRRRPTLEYILFQDFNDTQDDVRRLISVGKRIPCKINLIPFHSIGFTKVAGFGATLQPASQERIEQFAQALRNGNLTVMVRSSSGDDIQAACGQLAVLTNN